MGVFLKTAGIIISVAAGIAAVAMIDEYFNGNQRRGFSAVKSDNMDILDAARKIYDGIFGESSTDESELSAICEAKVWKEIVEDIDENFARKAAMWFEMVSELDDTLKEKDLEKRLEIMKGFIGLEDLCMQEEKG